MMKSDRIALGPHSFSKSGVHFRIDHYIFRLKMALLFRAAILSLMSSLFVQPFGSNIHSFIGDNAVFEWFVFFNI